jgi:GNAT superfamily N-acetyltransferase
VHETLVRVANCNLGETNEPPPEGLVISAVPESEVDEFFRIYLTAFGADPAGHAAAIANMRLLHRQPSLRFLCGRFGSEVAGIAMLYVDGKTGVLCAGATIERTRGRGVQRALIRARIALAREAGCDLIVSWTELGSPSSENLAACGLAPIYVDPVWFLPAPAALA